MNILKNDKHDYEWQLALNGLSALKEDAAWSYVVALARAPERARNGSLHLIVLFQKKEGLQLLDDMKNNYESSDKKLSKTDYLFYIKSAQQELIQKIRR